MNRFSTLDWIWCLTLVLSPAFQAGKLGISADTGQKLREIVSVLRLVWGPDFDSNYRKYMLGSSSIVTQVHHLFEAARRGVPAQAKWSGNRWR